MLSDEEKQSIESLKNIAIYIGDNYTFSQQGIRNLRENLRIVLPVIEKQSKEIEELKDKCKELIFEKQELTSALLDSIPNDKIKAKIEYKKDKLRQIQNFNDRYRIMCLQVEIDILQSLLEKE